ncbi:FKBP-type peptidyl-prolyl cis-trans isomerase [Winogradskyella forsetii]|uniref:FKBP-type peptidyl-prolyl cis-trans isomerase n=1 Tax=Winogradskyella forsetii TaxID=2686077 RepID=UPI0015BD8903|nr:FKBP-type peptidyl-prolyl cis-trans isomerase [Winogradskyella forsetii]
MKIKIGLVILTSTLLACNSNKKTGSNVTLTNNIDSVSYSIGASQAKGLLNQVPDLNIDAFINGYKDVADSTQLTIPEADQQIILQAFGKKMQEEQRLKQEKEQETKFADIKKASLDFLETNKSKSGVKTTESGLQYIVLQEGTGKQPEGPSSNVTVSYKGTTIDGTEFDSSDSYTTDLNRVIKGWTEGVQLMKEGAKYKFFIPEELAYGANPRPGGAIQPFMALIFEIELIKVN